jgi:hypothetical protein
MLNGFVTHLRELAFILRFVHARPAVGFSDWLDDLHMFDRAD